MNIPPLKRPFFSEDPAWEKRVMSIFIAISALMALILIWAWPATRSLDLAITFYGLLNRPLEIIFRQW